MKRLLLYTIMLILPSCVFADGRKVSQLADGWKFHNIFDVKKKGKFKEVTVPHTWNVQFVNDQLPADAQQAWADVTQNNGVMEYYRGMMIYNRTLNVTPDQLKGKRVFLYFHGVNSVADVFVNKQLIGEHKGGYTAFCYEVTDALHEGDNLLEVWASNAYRTDVAPISGDFNVYGGIHRPVELIVTNADCIDPTYYASPGVLISQSNVSARHADISIETRLNLKSAEGLTLKAEILDKEGNVVAGSQSAVSMSGIGAETTKLSMDGKLRLWQGRKDPYIYKVRVQLKRNGEIIDEVEQPLGLRSISVDADKGFFLNGQYLDLVGYNRHDDTYGRGSSLLPEHYRQDMQLILESGATAMRLAHYPHGEGIYNEADSAGIILWTETPMCGPGGMAFTGYLPTQGFEDNVRQATREMVLQKFNHPSVCLWGIFNEVLVTSKADGTGPATDSQHFQDYGNPVEFMKEINGIIKSMDTSRPTTFATCVNQTLYDDVADLIGWNKYFGWYSNDNSGCSKFFDEAHKIAGSVPVGVSEYGAGASIKHHQWPLDKSLADGHFHPEEAQTSAHELNWSVFKDRPFLWGKFIWLFADIQSYQRREGDRDGVNDKGVITYDRKTKKDAFYFYKANWNPEPMLYISSRRFVDRKDAVTPVKVFSNLKNVTLYVNNKKVGTLTPDDMHRCIWQDVKLQDGKNIIRIEGKSGKKLLTDECEWIVSH